MIRAKDDIVSSGLNYAGGTPLTHKPDARQWIVKRITIGVQLLRNEEQPHNYAQNLLAMVTSCFRSPSVSKMRSEFAELVSRFSTTSTRASRLRVWVW